MSLANALQLFRDTGRTVRRVKLIGGAAGNLAVRNIAAGLFGGRIELPDQAEYVALGAARQAAEVAGLRGIDGFIDTSADNSRTNIDVIIAIVKQSVG